MPLVFQFCVFAWLSAAINVVFHEVAHALVARLFRLHVMEVRMGSGKERFQWSIGKCRVHLGTYLFSGRVIAFPRTRRWLRCKMMAFVAAGPIVNGIFMWGCWRWLQRTAHNGDPEWMVLAAIVLAVASAFYLFASLWPATLSLYESAIPSDGKQLLSIPFYKSAKSGLIIANFHFFYGNRLAQGGEIIRGAAWIERGLRYPTTGQSKELLLGSAWLLAGGGRVDRAREIYLELLASDDVPHRSLLRRDAADGLACLGIYHERPDLLSEGKEIINQVIAEEPHAITLKGTLGGILYELGETEAARTVLQEVLEKSLSDLDRAISAAYLAVLAAREGDTAKAQTHAAMAASKGSGHRLVTRLLASLPANQTDGGSGTSK